MPVRPGCFFYAPPLASSICISPPDSLESLLEMAVASALLPTIVPRRVSIGSGASVGILMASVPLSVLVVFSGTLLVLVFAGTLPVLVPVLGSGTVPVRTFRSFIGN